MAVAQNFVVDLKKVDEDILLYGKLGSELASIAFLKINIPEGFVVTADAYFEFLKENNLQQKIRHLFASHKNDEQSLRKVAQHIRNIILEADMPNSIILATFKFYRSLGWKDKKVILIPSPTDPLLQLPLSTGVKGEAVLIGDIKEIWASYFSYELLFQRTLLNLSHFKTGIAVVVQKELHLGKSGYIENGQIIAKKKITVQEEKELLGIEQKILTLHFFPKRIRWIISQGKIYITKLSPAVDATIGEEQHDAEYIPQTPLPTGIIATGIAKIVQNKKDMENIRHGEIVILSALKNYDDIKAIRNAKALVVESGINSPHINMVLSRMGLPIVVDKNIRGKIRNGMVITVDSVREQTYQGGFRLS